MIVFCYILVTLSHINFEPTKQPLLFVRVNERSLNLKYESNNGHYYDVVTKLISAEKRERKSELKE